MPMGYSGAVQMGYRSNASYIAKDPAKRKKQLSGLKQNRAGTKNAYKTPDKYINDPIGFIEDHFYCVEGRKLIELIDFQKDLLKELFLLDVKPNLAVIGQPKKTGKSTFAAAIALWFLCTKPMSEIYLLASDVAQSQLVCYDKLVKCIRMNKVLRKSCKVIPGKGRIEFEDSFIQILSPNTSVAGINPSLIIAEELWSWTSVEHKRAWDELTNTPTREENLNLVTSYAGYSEDEDSILHQLYKQGIDQAEGRGEKDDRLLFRWYGEELYEHIPWVKPAYLPQQKRRLRENAYLRLHCNQWASDLEAFIETAVLDACINSDYSRGLPFTDGVAIGIDIGLKHDTSAIAIVGAIDKETLAVIDHAVFVPPKKRVLDLEKTVEAMMLVYQKTYDISAVYYDPYQFARSAKTLQNKGIRMTEFCQTVGNTVLMSETLSGLLNNQALQLYESAELRQHLLNAQAKETQRGWRLIKRRQAGKIDLAVALAMACQAAQDTFLLRTAAGFCFDPDPDDDDDDVEGCWQEIGTLEEWGWS